MVLPLEQRRRGLASPKARFRAQALEHADMSSTMNNVPWWWVSQLLPLPPQGPPTHWCVALQAVAVSTVLPRQALIFDLATGSRLAALPDGAPYTSPGSGTEPTGRAAMRLLASASWNTTDELVLYGCTLWDPRMPSVVHTFDQFTGGWVGNHHVEDGECRARRCDGVR